MGIKFEHINYKKDDNIIFDNLNLLIPYNKIIGLYGNELDDFINLLITKEFNIGKLVDDDFYLNNVYFVDNYDLLVTNNVKLYIKLDYNEKLENKIIEVLEKFDLDYNFFNRSISSLSNFENKLLHLIISMYDKNKVIIYKDLFNGIDYRNKSLFIRLIKNIKKNYKKLIFICDNDMDTINNLVDYLLIIDSNLIEFDNIDNIFNNNNIQNIDIEIPNIIKVKNILREKGIDTENIKNINDLLRK